MKIGEKIRKYRKEQNMTQEQVARLLGVSAPAVNKWENDGSYPDITLLAPLARLLKIDLNELLEFHTELTELEIGQFINELSENMMEKGFEQSFQDAVEMIRKYPNCNKLILWSAQVLNGYLVMKMSDIPDNEKYQKQIAKWYEKVAFCEEPELAQSAQMSLAQSLLKEKKYEEAQKLLDRIPKLGFDKRGVQVQLYNEQEQYEKSYEVLDTMLYQNAHQLLSTLMQIITVLCRQKEYERALSYTNKIGQVAECFDLGSYMEQTSYFTIYAEMADKDKMLDAFEKMMDSYETIGMAKNSELYRHMKFGDNDGLDKMRMMILKSIDNDPAFDLIREEPAFQKVMKKYNTDSE